MKTLIIFAAVVTVALSTPAVPLVSSFIPILEKTDIQDEAGQFAQSFVSANGIAQVSHGALKLNRERTGHVLVQKGAYSYTSPEGFPIRLEYVADENGFQAVGNHLPVPPAPEH